MRFVPASQELPDALRLSGLQVPVGLGGKSNRYTPNSLVMPLPRRDASPGALLRPKGPGRGAKPGATRERRLP